MNRVLALGLLACALSACGAGDESKGGTYNTICDSAHKCDEGSGWVCSGALSGRGICTTQCTADAQCMAHGSTSVCVGAGVGNGFCYDKCMDSVECPSQLLCTMSATEAFSTCRPGL